MKAMALREHCEIKIEGEPRKMVQLAWKENPLDLIDMTEPVPAAGQILVRISACGICHTELDEIEGRLMVPHLPVILGHEIVGRVESLGQGTRRYKQGDRVGIAWINSSCGICKFCRQGAENLCDRFQGTGLHANGGYAEYAAVSEEYAYPIPGLFSDAQAAPLLCAGVIGYRALRLSKIRPGEILALYGFGASAHIAIQVAKNWGCTVFVFTREGQQGHRELAKNLGADWVGGSGQTPPEKPESAIDFTPVGETVKEALRIVRKGGRVVVNAIRKVNPIPPLEYSEHIWHEKELKSVANVTRRDVIEFLPLAAEIGIRPEITEFALYEANRALVLLKQGKMHGAGVLRISREGTGECMKMSS